MPENADENRLLQDVTIRFSGGPMTQVTSEKTGITELYFKGCNGCHDLEEEKVLGYITTNNFVL